MSASNSTHSLVVIDEGSHNETTYMVDKCIVKTKFLSADDSDSSSENLEHIRSVLFSTLGISL